MTAEAQPIDVLLPISEVKRIVGFGKSTIYQGVRDKTFPAPVRCGSSNRWLLSEINDHIRILIAERKAA